MMEKNVSTIHPDDLALDLHSKELVQGKRAYYHMEKRYFSKKK
jgi:hypothetical protein